MEKVLTPPFRPVHDASFLQFVKIALSLGENWKRCIQETMQMHAFA